MKEFTEGSSALDVFQEEHFVDIKDSGRIYRVPRSIWINPPSCFNLTDYEVDPKTDCLKSMPDLNLLADPEPVKEEQNPNEMMSRRTLLAVGLGALALGASYSMRRLIEEGKPKMESYIPINKAVKPETPVVKEPVPEVRKYKRPIDNVETLLQLYSGNAKGAERFLAEHRDRHEFSGGRMFAEYEFPTFRVLYIDDVFKREGLDIEHYEQLKDEFPGSKTRQYASRRDMVKIVVAAAREQGVDPRLALPVVEQESKFSPYAMSKAGAAGLTQLMRGTFLDRLYKTDLISNKDYLRQLAKKFIMSDNEWDDSLDSFFEEKGFDRFDIALNLQLGLRYLGDLVIEHGMQNGLAAYNAGPRNVRKHNGIPNFKETINYVSSITRRYDELIQFMKENPGEHSLYIDFFAVYPDARIAEHLIKMNDGIDCPAKPIVAADADMGRA